MSTLGLSIVLAAAAAAATPTTGAAVPSTQPSPSATPSSNVAVPTLGRYQRSASAQALLTSRDAPPLTLDDALRIAFGGQPSIILARATTAASWARADEARAPLLPQLNGSASYQRTTGNYAPRPSSIPNSVPINIDNSFKTFNYVNFGLTLSQYIWDFGVTTDRWRSFKSTARQTGLTEKTTVATVTAQRAHCILHCAHRSRAGRRRARDLRRSGETSSADRRRRPRGTTAAHRPLYRPREPRDRRVAAHHLREQLRDREGAARAHRRYGWKSDLRHPERRDPDGRRRRPPTEALLPEAEKARPDLLQLVEQLRGQKLNISSAKGAYGPSIGAGASLTDAGTEFDKLGWNWSVSATATWSLFSGLLTYSQVKEQKLILTGVEAQVRQMRQQIRFDVEQARLAVNANKANTRATQEALDNARAQLKLAEGRYAQGLGNIVELSDAQAAVTTAAGNRAQADLNLAIARSQLLRALGRT